MLIKTTRRAFLSTLYASSAAALTVPLFRSLIPEARAAASTDGRFILTTMFNGLFTEGEDANKPMPGPPQSWDLGAYAPFEPWRDRLTWVEHMYNPFTRHLHGNRWPLTVAEAPDGSDGDPTPTGPSFDRFLAQRIGSSDPISSINLLLHPTRDNNTKSADGPATPYPVQFLPAEAYASIFGAVTGLDTAAIEAKLARDRSVLDHITSDIARLHQQLPADQRPKLDQMLDSVRGVESKLSALADVQCDASNPPDENLGTDRRAWVPEEAEAHIDIAALAMACGITRVALLDIPIGTVHFLDLPGQPIEEQDVGAHGNWHGGEFNPEKRVILHAYQTSLMLRLWEALELYPSADGTVADQSLMMAFATTGESHHNGSYTLQAMLVGDGGGAITPQGYLKLPDSPFQENDPRGEGDRTPKTGSDAPTRCLGDLFDTIATGFGVADSFAPPAHAQGPIEELLG